jgi:hypothetical protein
MSSAVHLIGMATGGRLAARCAITGEAHLIVATAANNIIVCLLIQ